MELNRYRLSSFLGQDGGPNPQSQSAFHVTDGYGDGMGLLESINTLQGNHHDANICDHEGIRSSKLSFTGEIYNL